MRRLVIGLCVLAGCTQEGDQRPLAGVPKVSDESAGPISSLALRPEQPVAAATGSPDSALAKPVGVNLADVEWLAGPPSLPRGARQAVLEGTPPFQSEQTYTILGKLPKNYRVAPHTHLGTERITVLAGTLFFGMGPTGTRHEARALRPGGIAIIPAGHPHHTFTTNQEVTVVVQGVGPSTRTYLDPADDPRRPVPPVPAPHESAYDSPVVATHLNADEIEYGPPPAGLLPPGAEIAVLEGTLPFAAQKTFVFRLRVPDGYRFAPHTHGVTDRPVVLAGQLDFAIGKAWKDEALRPMTIGAVGVLPRGTPHFAVARGETVIQVTGVGPFDMTWLPPPGLPGKVE